MARLATALVARAPLAEIAEQAQLVEGLGYDRIWLPEISGRDAFVTAAVLAGQTETIGIGLGVVPLPSRPLPALEMAAAALAESAPGRIAVGLGAGHRETARTQFGWHGTATPSEIEVAVLALGSALRDGVLEHRSATGEPVTLRLQGQHVPIPPELFVGALRPQLAAVAARCADGMLLNWVSLTRAERLCALVGELRDSRPFTIASYVPVCVVEGEPGRREAYREVAHQLSSYVQLAAYGDLLAEDGYADEVAAVRNARHRGEDATAAVSDRLVDAVALIGDAAEVGEGLRRFRAAGVGEPVLAPVTVGEDSAASLMGTWAALAPD